MNTYSDRKYNYTGMIKPRQMNNYNNYHYEINHIQDKGV